MTSFGKAWRTNTLEFDKTIWLVNSLAYRYPEGGIMKFFGNNAMQCCYYFTGIKLGVKTVVNDLVA